MKERIQKVLANAGVDSRRHVEEMILQGRIAVNGKVQWTLPVLIDPETDKVTVDDEPIKLASAKRPGARRSPGEDFDPSQRVYILMNKPKGVYTTNVAQGEQRRAIDLLPPKFPFRVYPVGQLDAEAKGLLLLTNDGDLTNLLTHPRYGVAKTYKAIVDGDVSPATLDELQQGIWLSDPHGGEGFKTGKSFIRVIKRVSEKSILEITMREGKNRQIRRMLAAVGHKVRDLTRTRMGPLTLDGLNPGEFRPLTPRELKDLKKTAAEGEKASQENPEPPPRTKPRASRFIGRTPPTSQARPTSQGRSSSTARPSASGRTDRAEFKPRAPGRAPRPRRELDEG